MSAVIVCDLDGVVWRGSVPIDGAADAIAGLRAAGFQVVFLTNNSARPVQAVCDQLVGLGVPAGPDDVISSAHAAAALLARDLPAGARVLVSGGLGIAEALLGRGLTAVANDGTPTGVVDAVVCGMDRDFDYGRLDRAARAVRDGARFVATNADATYPGADHLLPGAGALVAAVALAAGREPEIAGKPEAATVELVRERFGAPGIVVGDRPSTDGELARRLGWGFAMVLSGVGGHDPAEPVPDPPPALLGADLAALVDGLVGYLDP